jgi:hypothetical protein
MTTAKIENRILGILENDRACGYTLQTLWHGLDRNLQGELVIALASLITCGKVRRVDLVSRDINGNVFEDTNYRIKY